MVHAGLAMDGHPAGAGEDTGVTEEEELVGKATSFQDLPGCIVDMEGARFDFECCWRQIMQTYHRPGCGVWIERN